jgi:hypothetical protein
VRHAREASWAPLVFAAARLEALERVQGLLAVESFELTTSQRPFQVVTHDHLADLVVPAMVRRISTEAPRARLEVLP